MGVVGRNTFCIVKLRKAIAKEVIFREAKKLVSVEMLMISKALQFF